MAARHSLAAYVAPRVAPPPTRVRHHVTIDKKLQDLGDVVRPVEQSTSAKRPLPEPQSNKSMVRRKRSVPHGPAASGYGKMILIAVGSSMFTLALCVSLLLGLLQGSDYLSKVFETQATRITIAILEATETRKQQANIAEINSVDALQKKSGITGGVAYKFSAGQAWSESAADTGVEEVAPNVADEPEDETALQPAVSALPEGVPSMLIKGRRGLEVGNFNSTSMEAPVDECVNLGYGLLSDVGESNDLLDVMVATEQITIAKICAANGSIVMTCRAGRMTISPRRRKPNDGCTKA